MVPLILLLIAWLPPPISRPAGDVTRREGDAADDGDTNRIGSGSRCEKAADRAPSFRSKSDAGALHRPG